MTGGAGFIGSYLVDALITHEANISVFDNLTAGTLSNIEPWLHRPNLTFIKGELLNHSDLKKLTHNNHHQLILHLAAGAQGEKCLSICLNIIRFGEINDQDNNDKR